MSDTNALSKLRYPQTLLAIAVEKIPPGLFPFPFDTTAHFEKTEPEVYVAIGPNAL